jgi:hypothetical protein
MNRKINSSGIVHYQAEYVIVEEKQHGLSLPYVNLNLGLDSVKELKQEIQKEFILDIRYEKTLPDAWSTLLMLHSGNLETFINFHIFTTEQFDKRDRFWYKIDDLLELDELEEQDKDALIYFKDNIL